MRKPPKNRANARRVRCTLSSRDSGPKWRESRNECATRNGRASGHETQKKAMDLRLKKPGGYPPVRAGCPHPSRLPFTGTGQPSLGGPRAVSSPFFRRIDVLPQLRESKRGSSSDVRQVWVRPEGIRGTEVQGHDAHDERGARGRSASRGWRRRCRWCGPPSGCPIEAEGHDGRRRTALVRCGSRASGGPARLRRPPRGTAVRSGARSGGLRRSAAPGPIARLRLRCHGSRPRGHGGSELRSAASARPDGRSRFWRARASGRVRCAGASGRVRRP